MPEYRPLPGQRINPPDIWPPPPPRPNYGKRRRKVRNWLLLLFILMIGASLLAGKQDEWFRMLPFIRKDAPPITGLHPIVLAKTDELVAESAKLGIDILITDDFRSHDDQDKLYEQGRSAGGPVVTHARGGQSFHNYGLAVDFALRTKKGQVIWDMEFDGNRNRKADWMEVVDIAKRLGFSWGGDWKGFKDYPHLQMDFGYSIGELQRGYRPPDETP